MKEGGVYGSSSSWQFVLMSNEEQPAEAGRDGLNSVRIVCHGRCAPALQLGLDPDLRPAGAIQQLQHLLNRNAFWGQGRSLSDLRRMVTHSAVCVTAWRGRQLIGFGRATSDSIFRGTIWDVVVDSEEIGQGIGKTIVATLLASGALLTCERVYLMTTNSADFYKKLGFEKNSSQILMIKTKSG
ncbi:MAG: GNAT family N-acetyltransferase [Cyanobacteriota bacterium]|nr:GNAT family N-acetyltransferase [Cyanobacteriota bacterium]